MRSHFAGLESLPQNCKMRRHSFCSLKLFGHLFLISGAGIYSVAIFHTLRIHPGGSAYGLPPPFPSLVKALSRSARNRACCLFRYHQTKGRGIPFFGVTVSRKVTWVPDPWAVNRPTQCPVRLGFSRSNAHRRQGSAAVTVHRV